MMRTYSSSGEKVLKIPGKRISLLALVGFVAQWTGILGAQEVVLLDEIVARVNDEIITMTDLNLELQQLRSSLQQGNPKPQALEQEGIAFVVAEITQIPQSLVRLEEKAAERMLKLVEALDDYEDVQKVYANFDIADEIMQKAAAG